MHGTKIKKTTDDSTLKLRISRVSFVTITIDYSRSNHAKLSSVYNEMW